MKQKTFYSEVSLTLWKIKITKSHKLLVKIILGLIVYAPWAVMHLM